MIAGHAPNCLCKRCCETDVNMTNDNKHVIYLNEYQRSNLMELLKACGLARDGQPAVFDYHTGDWLAEIYWMLDKLGPVTHAPNVSLEDLRKSTADVKAIASYVPALREAVDEAASLVNEMGYDGADFPKFIWKAVRRLEQAIRKVPGQSHLCGYESEGESESEG